MASDPISIERHTACGWWGQETLDAHFTRNAKEFPDRTAIVDPPNRFEITGTAPENLTYRELQQRVDALVRCFDSAGIKREDIVAVQLPNINEVVVILLACARMGVIASPIVMQFDKAELSDIFSQLEPAAYITLSKFKDRAMSDSMLSVCTQHDVTLLNIDSLTFDTDAAPIFQGDHRPTQANEVLTICWTSGTEGRAKGVMRSHNLWNAIGKMVAWGTRLEAGDVILNARPLVNMAAIGGSFYSWLICAGTLVLHHPLDMALVLRQIREHRVNVTIMPPAFIVALLKESTLKAHADLSSLRVMGSGSAALPDWAVLQMEKEFQVEIINFFGSNEGVSLQSTARTVPDSRLRATHFARAGRSEIPWPVFDYNDQLETKIVDLDTGQEIIERGKPGELLIKGSTVFSYYYNQPELTKNAFDEAGFYRSGDLFELDGEDLRLYKFVGRCREVIIRGGFNISPTEIDNLLSDHSSVSEVAAFGVPDDRLGERIAVAVVVKPNCAITLEDITNHLQAKQIAKFKLPEHLITLDQLPRNAMQKVLRAELKLKFCAQANGDTREVYTA